MPQFRNRSQRRDRRGRFSVGAILLLAFFLAALASACSQLEKPTSTPYYAETQPPPKQEFRWSNGKLPRSFDPAKAAAPPETDIVRALYEGLTEIDPATMKEIPGVAEKWTSSDDHRNWTFYLRENARWSNGKPVTAFDFVSSWKRLADLGDKAAHEELLSNIMGFPQAMPKDTVGPGETTDLFNSLQRQTAAESNVSNSANALVPPTLQARTSNSNMSVNAAPREKGPAPVSFGVVAADARTLNVSLLLPDRDFPKLVAHPIFRPIFDSAEGDGEKLRPNVITNGAFHIASIAADGITLVKSDSYWNRDSVKLERVRFVPYDNAEKALQAYRAGDLDAVTNAEFAPLALKLLEPFQDFRRTTHSALNFYEVNYEKPPFDDRRVREALAIALERERLTEGDLVGSTRPALPFTPFSNTAAAIVPDKERARVLLEEAGYPEGENFPAIRLVVNRNDTQQRIARSVAKMWKQNLNLETDIIVKEPSDLDAARKAGDFDLIRRGVVLPTPDETASFLSIFPSEGPLAVDVSAKHQAVHEQKLKSLGDENSDNAEKFVADDVAKEMILSEEDALFQFHAIPLYFPTSCSLVKPYVAGFEMNGLDAPLLNSVTIDNTWQPKTAARESN